jgi:hypothetical protein
MFILIYLLDSLRYVSYSFYLFSVEKTLHCGAKDITASIHVTWKAPEIVQVNLNSHTVGNIVTEDESW